MRVALSTSPKAKGDWELRGLPFLGLGYIASYLEKAGYEVKIFDPHTFLESPEQIAKKIIEFNPQAVGLTSTTETRFQAINLIKMIKREISPLIFVGGPHFSSSARDALNCVPEIDCVIRGEGEITTKEMLETFPDYEKMRQVQGIVFRNKNQEIVETPERPFFHNINQFPWPAWHLYELSRYKRPIQGTAIKAVGMISSRGCPNRCTFCASVALWKSTLRKRDPVDFVDEVEFLQKNYGIQGFDFWDDTFTIDRSHAELICREILKRNLGIKWYATLRVNTVDGDLLDLMKSAGCVRVSFGVESGSPRILQLVKKGITVEQARKAINLASASGLKTIAFFIVNLPLETREDLQKTIDLIKEFRALDGVYATYGFSIIYPGTEMESVAKSEGILPENFSWNSPFRTKKYKIVGVDPGLPYMEWPGSEIEKIKGILLKELGAEDIFKRVLSRIKRVRSWQELKTLIKIGISYLK